MPEKTMPLDFHCSIGVSIPNLTSISAFISISPSHVATKNSVLSRGLDLPGNNLIQRFGQTNRLSKSHSLTAATIILIEKTSSIIHHHHHHHRNHLNHHHDD